MRTSRDLVRPLVVLVVVLASLPLVSTVAAFRAASTPHHQVQCPQADSATGGTNAQAAQQCTTKRSSNRESGESGEYGESGEGGGGRNNGGGVSVVTSSGAS